MARVTKDSVNCITSHYGARSGGFHNGVDIGWSSNEENNKVYANCKGTVETVVTGQPNTYPNGARTWGNYIRIKHNNGYTSLYAHLGQVNVHVGQTVDENTCIAVMGNTGYSSARHLHFEVKDSNGNYINPEPYLTKAISDVSPQPIPIGNEKIKSIQTVLNSRYETGLVVDGIYGNLTHKAMIKGLQTEFNKQCGAKLVIDGIFGVNTKNACPILRMGDRGNITYLVQSMLCIKGISIATDGIYGANTKNAVINFQKKNSLVADGVVGKNTFEMLFR